MALNRLLDAELDARNPRTASRELPTGALSRVQVIGLSARLARRLPRRRLPARPDRPLALADPGRAVLRLPVPQALHVALSSLARRLPRPRAGRRVARRDRRGAVGGVGTRRRSCALGRGLRSLLLALRSRARPARGAPFVGRALRRARGVRGRAGLARGHRPSARARRSRPRGSVLRTGSASPRSPRCSATSTRSSARETSAA